MKIQIRKIKTGTDRRQTSEVKVRELAESIKQNGLINPITIGRDNFLIAGLHRLEACKLLGWKEIECKKEDCIHNEDKFKLLEIDENLIRSELDYITRGDLQVEKDEILERLGLRAEKGDNQFRGGALGAPPLLKGTGAPSHRLNKGALGAPLFSANKGEPNSPLFKTTANLAKEIGISERTLQEEKQISRSLSAEVKKIAREIELPKKDAIELSKKTHEEQKKIIDEIKEGNTLKNIQKKQTYNAKVTKELPKEVYSVILADPPWSYSNSGFNQSAANKYPTMPTEEICKLNIEKLADKDSVLFLWVTVPLLPDGLRVMESWGYSYKTSMVWIKDRSPGIGFWLNTKHEILLIGSKGSFLPLNKVDSIIKGEVTKHSKKPEVTYSLIEKMFPKAKYIELFARNKRSNWSNWGNETL